LPRYAGAAHAEQITRARLPMGTREACAMGLLDEWFGVDKEDFERQLVGRANTLALSPDYAVRLEEKRVCRRRDEAIKPLARYRDEELEKMRLNFYGFDPSYHVARYNFVYKVPRSRTPLTLASHRRTRPADTIRNAS
jgi:putative two-component system hydrogenase maturation factor HypX/HoxX